MKKLTLFLLFSFAVVACAADSNQLTEQFKQDAAMQIKALASNLKKELSAAMQAGGPVAAVEVCKVRAPEITQYLNDTHNNNLSIKRTSLKLRNQSNAPDAWEKQVLTSFTEQLANGTPAEDLIHVEQIKSESNTTLKLMRAIPTQGLCLVCHGDKQTMSEDLVKAIELTYPHDKATGYQVGDIRGAFSVTQIIEN